MTNIIYRHYKTGDEKSLADLFIIGFQQNGPGNIRTPKNWIWRYPQSPEFEPEMCQIAEDVDENKIVGAVYANLIEEIPFGDKKYLVGDINDVTCHPDYTRRGIATRLMEMALDYMRKKECKFSILSTGLRGNARKYIYTKLGFRDYEKGCTFFQFPNIIQFVRNIYAFSLFLPALFILSFFPRYLNRIKIRYNNFFKDISYEINFNKKHFEYMKVANNLLPKYYEGYPSYNKSKFEWARIKVPSERHKPTYILMKKEKEIIGGAVITHLNIYAFKYGLKLRIGVIHEIFLNSDIFMNKKDVQLGYNYLIDKVLKAATRRALGVLIYKSTINNRTLNQAFKSMNFIRFNDDVIMIKELLPNLKAPCIKKPLFISTSISIGFP